MGEFMKYIFSIVISLILCGCASVIQIDTLTAASESKSVKINKFSYSHQNIGLRNGIYRAEYQNKKGVFYRGPENCTTATKLYQEGGLFISHSEIDREYQVYYYIDIERPALRIGFVDYLVDRDNGQIALLPNTTDIDIEKYVEILH
jgi:hypothetical protein